MHIKKQITIEMGTVMEIESSEQHAVQIAINRDKMLVSRKLPKCPVPDQL